jgi:hypothetical protein
VRRRRGRGGGASAAAKAEAEAEADGRRAEAEAQHVRQGRAWLQEMQAAGVLPTRRTFNTLLKLLGRAGQLDPSAAEATLRLMRDGDCGGGGRSERHAPDEHTLHSLVTGMAKAGHARGAVEWAERLWNEGRPPCVAPLQRSTSALVVYLRQDLGAADSMQWIARVRQLENQVEDALGAVAR